jgi:hypothetical protein
MIAAMERLDALTGRKEESSMPYPKGFSPHRYHPGAKRVLVLPEEELVGTPCPHCSKPLVKLTTPFSEFVACPGDTRLYFDPFAEDNFWRFKRAAGLKGTWKKVDRVAPAVTFVDEDGTVIGKSIPLAHGDGETILSRSTKRAAAIAAEEAAKAKMAEAFRTSAPKRVEEAQAAKAAVIVEPKDKFPYARFRKLADAVQAAHLQDKLGSGYSLRRELMTARLWAALAPQTDDERALHLAFALVGSERCTDDERPLYEELWRAQMGAKLYPLPSLKALPTEDGEVWHPQAALAYAAIQAGVPLWLSGVAGAGKTHLTRQIAKLCGLPYVRLQGSRDRTVDDVIGAWGYDAKVGSVFRPGVVVETARTGGLLHIDEVAALPHEVTFELHAVLEGEPLTVLKNSGEVVKLNENFRMVANDNSVGEGEQVSYVGLHATNLAFRDRWAFLRVEPIPEDLRKKLILREAGE